MNIEKIRFQERLLVSFDVDSSLLDGYVPNMILQPLVENAIHHGIGPNAEQGSIRVSARMDGDLLVIDVKDNGQGIQEKKASDRREGVGLSNTRGRLESIYGDEANFELVNSPEGGLIARVSLPFGTSPVISPRTSS
jgi:LytS/YehU family sensor histidine kinase